MSDNTPLTDDEMMSYMLSSAMPSYEELRLYAFRASIRIQQDIEALAQEREQRRVLVRLLALFVEDGPYLNTETSECLNCGNRPYVDGKYIGWTNLQHASNCAWRIAKEALEQAQAPTGAGGSGGEE